MKINLDGPEENKIVIRPDELKSQQSAAADRTSNVRAQGSTNYVTSNSNTGSTGNTSNSQSSNELWFVGGAVALVGLILLSGVVYYRSLQPNDDFGIEDQQHAQTSSGAPRQPGNHGAALQATQQYWSQLGKIFASLASEEKETASQTSQRFSDAARRVSALSVMGVDQEAIEIGTAMIELTGHTEVVFQGWQRLVDDSQALGNRANSSEVMIESMLRGFLGDPLGTTDDLLLEKGKLDQRQQELLRQLELVQRESNDLRAKATKARAKLSARYGVEFPPLN